MIISERERNLAKKYREKYLENTIPFGDLHIILTDKNYHSSEDYKGVDITTGENVFIKKNKHYPSTIVISNNYGRDFLMTTVEEGMIFLVILTVKYSVLEKQDGFKCKKIIAIGKNKKGFVISETEEHQFYDYSYIDKIIGSFLYYEWIDEKKSVSDFNKIFGRIIFNKKYEPCILDSKIKICNFLRQEEAVRKYGKRQILIDNISRKKLKKVPFKDISNRVVSYAVIQKVDEEHNVIRAFTQYNNDRTEVLRFYFNEDECIRCRNSIDGWICVKGIQSKNMKYNIELDDIDKDCLDNGIIKYIMPILKAIPIERRMLAIYDCVCNPIVEQLFKAGFDSLIYYIITTQKHTIEKHLKEHLYVVNPDKKTLAGQLGFNNYQLKKIASYYQSAIYDDEDGDWDVNVDLIKDNFLYKLGNIFLYYGEVDLSSIDNKTFDELFDRMVEVSKNWDLYCALSGVYIGEGMDAIKSFISSYDTTIRIKENIESKHKMFESNPFGIDLYDLCETALDILRMAREVNERVSLNNINTYEELMLLHDNVNIMYNIHEGRDFKDYDFSKFYKQWDRYTFSNDSYSIIYPKTPIDLALEGISLHHCVKSYTDAVDSGRTTILFLRRNESPDVPYFTIEVRNREIRQIHGLCNCNLPKNDEVGLFVKNWIEDKKLIMNDSDRLLGV